MAKNNYYAVLVGRKPGIYTSWDDCKAQVDKYPKAEYKCFKTKFEAESYFNHKIAPEEQVFVDAKYYVDGSFYTSHNVYGYGMHCIPSNGKPYSANGCGIDKECAKLRNVAGEMIGSMRAVQDALKHGYQSISIHYDYYGIEKWVTGEWKTEAELTKKYADYMISIQAKIKIRFVKVKAHSGDQCNNIVDGLAKTACIEYINSFENS